MAVPRLSYRFGLLFHGFCEEAGEVDEGLTIRTVGKGGGLTGVSAFADALDDRNLAEERNAVSVSHFLAAILSEDVVLVLRKFLWCEPGHILHEAEDLAVYVLLRNMFTPFSTSERATG